MTRSNWVFVEGQRRHSQDGSNLVFLMKGIGKGIRPVKAVDIGCGDGIIAYDMLKYKKATSVFALDISKEAIVAAGENLQGFVEAGTVAIERVDARRVFGRRQWSGKFDLAVINPPFFSEGSGIESQRGLDNLARRDKRLPLRVWARGASKLLRSGGELYCVFPTERLAELVAALKLFKLEPKSLWWASHDRRKRRFFLRAVKDGKCGLRVETDFAIPAKGHHQE
ncbi:MAG: methyltransferase [Oligoflexia bacterium]|nr:methyltransferase [Oligoflexia bacterium]